MKTLNRLFCVTAVAAMLGASSIALGGPGHSGPDGSGHHPVKGEWSAMGEGKMFEKMSAELALTPEQKSEITTVLEAAREQGKTLHESMRAARMAERDALESGADEATLRALAGNSADARVSMMLHSRETKKKIDAVLTEEQRQQWKKVRSEHRQMMHDHMKQRMEKRRASESADH